MFFHVQCSNIGSKSEGVKNKITSMISLMVTEGENKTIVTPSCELQVHSSSAGKFGGEINIANTTVTLPAMDKLGAGVSQGAVLTQVTFTASLLQIHCIPFYRDLKTHLSQQVPVQLFESINSRQYPHFR